MKNIFILLFVLGSFSTLSNAQMKCQAGKCGVAMESEPKTMPKLFQTVSPQEATILQAGDAKLFCPQCGMNLPMYYRTNHAASVDGKVKQYCSMHCLLEDMEKEPKLTDIQVVDNASLKFIDATKAYYVVGSNKPATMSMLSKYAFALKSDAEHFAKDNGGEVVSFEEAMKITKANLNKDSLMIAKKQAILSDKGEQLYQEKCQKSDQKFDTIADAKSFITIKKLCQKLSEKELQAIGLYLKNR